MTERKHHFLIAGNVLFQNKTSQDFGSVPLNGVLISDRKDIPAASLAKAQQILQMRFYKNMGNAEEVVIVDVVLQSIVYLGEFTEEEFQANAVAPSAEEAAGKVLDSMEQANAVAAND
jgi:hypothetical protein